MARVANQVLFLFPEFPLDDPKTGGEIYNAEVIKAVLADPAIDARMVPQPQHLPSWIKRNTLLRRAWYQIACLAAVIGQSADLIITDGSYHSWVLLAVAYLRYVRHIPMAAMAYHVRHVASRRSGLGLFFERWGERSLYRMMQHMITCSYAARDDFGNDGLDPSKIAVFYPATNVDLPLDTCVDQWSQQRQASENLRMVCVGKVVKRKGYHHLLAACSQLDQPWTLDIIGAFDETSSYTQQLRDMVVAHSLGDRVRFRGFVTRDELAEAYQQATLFCLASLHEGYGIVLVEAMGYGLPIVATTAGSIPELVESNVSGLLVAPGDPDALCHAIKSLVQDPALYHRLATGARHRALVLERDWDDVAQDALAQIQAWLNGAKPS